MCYPKRNPCSLEKYLNLLIFLILPEEIKLNLKAYVGGKKKKKKIKLIIPIFSPLSNVFNFIFRHNHFRKDCSAFIQREQLVPALGFFSSCTPSVTNLHVLISLKMRCSHEIGSYLY